MRHHDEIEPLPDECVRKFIPAKDEIVRTDALNQAIADIREPLRMRRVGYDDHVANHP